MRLDTAQYAAFGRALATAEAGGTPWQAVEALRLLALTGARAGEIGNLKRSECDLRNSLLALADTKTGASLGRSAKPQRRWSSASLLDRLTRMFSLPGARAAGLTRACLVFWSGCARLNLDRPPDASRSAP